MIALKFALLVPGVAMLTLGGVDLYSVYSTKSRMQEIADAAALAGARELGLAVQANGPIGRARAYVDGHMDRWEDHPELTTNVEVITLEGDTRAVRVQMDGRRPSFFGNLLPPGGWKMAAESIATSIAVTPLCVLTHGGAAAQGVVLVDQSQIRAPDCMIHSNDDIGVQGGRIVAAAVQSVGPARGAISPVAVTGAAPIEDPFAQTNLGNSLDLLSGVGCTLGSTLGTLLPTVVRSGRVRLRPGKHCNGYRIEGTGEVILEPGEHYFMAGNLVLRGDARMRGENVVLFFDAASRFEFRERSMVYLDGRETGPYAGIVMATTRENTQDFIISSDNVESLLGVIYIPSATLVVEGSADVARESAWTVIVAQSLRMTGAPALYINADYGTGGVPVPAGVGPRGGGSRLVD